MHENTSINYALEAKQLPAPVNETLDGTAVSRDENAKRYS